MPNVPNKFVPGTDFSALDAECGCAGGNESTGINLCGNLESTLREKLSRYIRSALFAVMTGSSALGAVPGCATAYNSQARIAGSESYMGRGIFRNFNFSNYPRFSDEDLGIANARSRDDLVEDKNHCYVYDRSKFCSKSEEGDSLKHIPDSPQVYYTVDGANFEVNSVGSLVVFLENAKNRNLIKNFFLYEFARIFGEELRFNGFRNNENGFGDAPLDIMRKKNLGNTNSAEQNSSEQNTSNKDDDEEKNREGDEEKKKIRYFEEPDFKERLAKARKVFNLSDLHSISQLRQIFKLIGDDPELYGLFINFAVQYDWDPSGEAEYQFRHPVDTLQKGLGDCDDYSMIHYFWAHMQGYKPYLIYTIKTLDGVEAGNPRSQGHVFVWYFDKSGNRVVFDNRSAYKYLPSVSITEIVKHIAVGDWQIVENLHHPVRPEEK